MSSSLHCWLKMEAAKERLTLGQEDRTERGQKDWQLLICLTSNTTDACFLFSGFLEARGMLHICISIGRERQTGRQIDRQAKCVWVCQCLCVSSVSLHGFSAAHHPFVPPSTSEIKQLLCDFGVTRFYTVHDGVLLKPFWARSPEHRRRVGFILAIARSNLNQGASRTPVPTPRTATNNWTCSFTGAAGHVGSPRTLLCRLRTQNRNCTTAFVYSGQLSSSSTALL